MRIKNIEDVNAFLRTVNECKSNVWLESADGDKLNLKSSLSQYVAIAALISAEGNSLELFCSDQEDTARFMELFSKHNDIER